MTNCIRCGIDLAYCDCENSGPPTPQVERMHRGIVGARADVAEAHATIANLRRQLAEAREEVAELVQEIFTEGAAHIVAGDMAGWWDTCGRTSMMEAGDRLVALKLWERHPGGYGRRWFYRPVVKP